MSKIDDRNNNDFPGQFTFSQNYITLNNEII